MHSIKPKRDWAFYPSSGNYHMYTSECFGNMNAVHVHVHTRWYSDTEASPSRFRTTDKRQRRKDKEGGKGGTGSGEKKGRRNHLTSILIAVNYSRREVVGSQYHRVRITGLCDNLHYGTLEGEK